MIHILTSHHGTSDFIFPQHHFIRKNIKQDVKIWGIYDGEDIDCFKPMFYNLSNISNSLLSIKENIPNNLKAHQIKLEYLVDKVESDPETKPEDIIIFLDGDAFPIAPLDSWLWDKLQKHSLTAIQRIENGFDIHPTSMFCATTLKFWREIKGNWSYEGYRWYNFDWGDSRHDVGAALLKILIEKRVNWWPMHRTNKKNVHPVFYGIYDDVVYHHGAGMRGRVDAYYVGEKNNPFNKDNYKLAQELETKMINNEDFFTELS